MEHVDWRAKGFWWPGPPVSLAQFAAARHGLFDGAFTWPVLVARNGALAHNIDTLARFCARHEIELAPHGKTTMAPALWARQLRAGAVAVTVATANQLLACHALGVRRVLLANELLDPVPLRWLAREIEQGFDVLCFVDSAAGVQAMLDAGGRFRVLVELGFPGGRSGCRSLDSLVALARAVDAAPMLELAGVAAYDGGLPDAAAAARFLDGVRKAVLELADLLPDEVVVSAGGSSFFDVVADRLAGQWLPGHRLRVVLRSGAYVSHDDGLYHERTPFRRLPDEGSLRAALEIWAQVTSVPEPGLAIVGMGKRDVSYDAGLPIPRSVRTLDGETRPADGLSVTAINDHHAYVSGSGLKPGELIGFGISHPCTAFDKWQLIPVVDDDYVVTDLLRTYF